MNKLSQTDAKMLRLPLLRVANSSNSSNLMPENKLQPAFHIWCPHPSQNLPYLPVERGENFIFWTENDKKLSSQVD